MSVQQRQKKHEHFTNIKLSILDPIQLKNPPIKFIFTQRKRAYIVLKLECPSLFLHSSTVFTDAFDLINVNLSQTVNLVLNIKSPNTLPPYLSFRILFLNGIELFI